MTFDGRKFIRDLMCRQVRFNAAYHRVYGPGGERGWAVTSIREPQVGWVVGATRLQTGRRHPGYNAGFFDVDGGEGPSFEETATRKLCYLVVTWPTKRPDKVPPEAVEVIPGQQHEQVWPVEPQYFDETTRRLQSETIRKCVERDERGRFRG